jgi:TetR/AcrR family transcriptional regulator, transcriptional repressor for nem operon
MPYTTEHKQQTRTRIIQSARRLFNRNGFADVSIGDIMGEAGLTHGGFYKHFSAKEELYEAAVMQFIRSDHPESWQMRHVDPAAHGAALARMIVDAYLSDDHFQDREASCPMIALPSDVARGNEKVKSAFRHVHEMMVGAFTDTLGSDSRSGRDRALALVSMVVGAMVLARAVDDPKLATEIRNSARAQVYETAGWDLKQEAAA